MEMSKFLMAHEPFWHDDSIQVDYLYNDSQALILNLCHYRTDRRGRDLNYPHAFGRLTSLQKSSAHTCNEHDRK
jgi:hypothetical protein